MATTIRSDTVIPEVLEEAIRGAYADMQALQGTGAGVVITRGFPDARGGETITMPYFGTIGEFEDLASDEGAGGAIPALTPAKLAMTEETASVQHSGKAFEVTEWAQLAAAYADPYAEAARQLRVAWERRIDLALITQALATTLTHDIWAATATTDTVLSWETILDARFEWGDEQNGIALAVMHSDVARDLLKQTDANDRPIYEQRSLDEGSIIQVGGIPVRISNKMTKTTDATDDTKYETLLCKRNALAFWMQGNAPVQTDRDILSDTHVAALHTYWAAHMYKRLPGETVAPVVKVIHNIASEI